MKSYSILFALISIFFYNNSNAQGTGCEVALKSVAGTYTGDCSKGKASGKGMSVGTDKYTGEFKAGLPDGKGVYEWKNGDIFDGLWAKGLREGRGVMTFKRPGKTDSILLGIWRKDVYAGNYDRPFVVYQKSSYIARVEARRNGNSDENTITFSISSASAGTNRVGGGTTSTAAASLGDISIIKGSFAQIMEGPARATGTTKRLIKVNYPFRAIYRIGNQELEMEIFEPGDWTVNVSINQ